MSPSAQEMKSQIAEMREGLRSARQSAKVGKAVGILAVIAGLAIVALYVNAFFQMGKRVVESPEVARVARQRVEQLQLDRTLRTVVQEAAPTYVSEARAMAEDMDLMQTIQDQAQAMLQDLQPAMKVQVRKMQPRLEAAVQAQGEQTLQALEGMVESTIRQRLTEMLAEHTQSLSATGADAETLREAVTNLREASLEAFTMALQTRAGKLEAELDKFTALLEEIPPLRPRSEEQLRSELGKVLVALLKHKLPDYEFRGMGPAAETGGKQLSPEQKARALEEAKAEAEKARQKAEAAAKQARERAEEEADNE